MIFIYDVVANFNDDLIDFYDWLDTDYLEHIRKIPMIKISEKLYNDFINKKIKVTEEYLNKIKNKTEVFSDNSIEKIEYASIITTNGDSFICIFDNSGTIKEQSRLLIDEELEILEIVKGMEYYKLDYVYVNNHKIKSNLLRKEKLTINKIISILNQINENNNEELLKYLYYEWFLTYPKSSNYYNKLINDIKKEYTKKHETFLNLINFSVSTK